MVILDLTGNNHPLSIGGGCERENCAQARNAEGATYLYGI
jgi:hypothetical protein